VANATVQSTKTLWHTWAVGLASLLWNSVGAIDFVMTQTRNKEWMSGLTPAQLDFIDGFPFWVVAAWGLAVWGGVLGSLLLLLRKRLAAHLFLLSLIGIVVSKAHNYLLSNGLKVMGGVGSLSFAAVILVIGVLLLVYARSMCKRGVLR